MVELRPQEEAWHRRRVEEIGVPRATKKGRKYESAIWV